MRDALRDKMYRRPYVQSTTTAKIRKTRTNQATTRAYGLLHEHYRRTPHPRRTIMQLRLRDACASTSSTRRVAQRRVNVGKIFFAFRHARRTTCGQDLVHRGAAHSARTREGRLRTPQVHRRSTPLRPRMIDRSSRPHRDRRRTSRAGNPCRRGARFRPQQRNARAHGDWNHASLCVIERTGRPRHRSTLSRKRRRRAGARLRSTARETRASISALRFRSARRRHPDRAALPALRRGCPA